MTEPEREELYEELKGLIAEMDEISQEHRDLFKFPNNRPDAEGRFRRLLRQAGQIEQELGL